MSGRSEVLWFLGTLARMKLDGRQTAGRFALWEAVLPRGAAPPLHSHPQDETFYILEGEVIVWLVELELAADEADLPVWVETQGRRCTVGTAVFAPGGTPHTFRNVGTQPGVILVGVVPGGFEKMFEERQGVDAETNQALMKKHNMEAVGPPLQ